MIYKISQVRLPNKSVIYRIKNNITNCCYIGSAKNLNRRRKEHYTSLNTGNHHSAHIQRSWNKHGEDSFTIEVLANCPPEYLLKLEQWFIDNTNSEYNMSKTAGSKFGMKLSKETRAKMSSIHTGKKMSDKARENMSRVRSKPVIQYTKSGVFIKEWKSIKIAQEQLNDYNISAVCNGKRKTSKGFMWKFKN